MAFTPRTWSLEEMITGTSPDPTSKDPQTGGDIWGTWLLERTPARRRGVRMRRRNRAGEPRDEAAPTSHN